MPVVIYSNIDKEDDEEEEVVDYKEQDGNDKS